MTDKRDNRAQPPLFLRVHSSTTNTGYRITHSAETPRPRICSRCRQLRRVAVTVNREPMCVDCIRELAGADGGDAA